MFYGIYGRYLKPCQRKVLFEREYSSEQDAMIYKCEYAMRAVAINCKRLTANQAEQMDKFAMMGIYNGGCFNCLKIKERRGDYGCYI